MHAKAHSGDLPLVGPDAAPSHRRGPTSLALTPELVALTMRKVEDAGPDPGVPQFDDADYAELVAALLAGRPPENIWLFAYGSLIWNPACVTIEQRVGTARGWHRAFRLKISRWRGTKEQPGLMMGLDRGGGCTGLLQRLPAESVVEELGKLLRREMSRKPPGNVPRWLKVDAAGGPVEALGFVMNRNGYAYAGSRPHAETAEILARACGHLGSGAEYLHRTCAKLAEHGIHDRNLWELQRLVAERIREGARLAHLGGGTPPK
jgi:cation transport protein ChaC